MESSTCKECGKEVSSEAAACPHCGHPAAPQSDTTSNNNTLKIIIISCIVVIALIVIMCAGI